MNEALENVYPAGEGARCPYSHMLLLSGHENEVASEVEGPMFQEQLYMPTFGSKAHKRQVKGVQNQQKRSDGINLGHLPCLLHGQIRACFTDVKPVQFYRVLLLEGPHV